MQSIRCFLTCCLPHRHCPRSSSSGPCPAHHWPPWPAAPDGSSWSRLEWGACCRWQPPPWLVSPRGEYSEASRPNANTESPDIRTMRDKPSAVWWDVESFILTTSPVSSSDEWWTSTHSPSSSSSLMLALSQPSVVQDEKILGWYQSRSVVWDGILFFALLQPLYSSHMDSIILYAHLRLPLLLFSPRPPPGLQLRGCSL